MKAIILSLITITACLLLTGCGGGGGGGSSGGSSSPEPLLNTTTDGGGDGNNGGGGGNGNGSNDDGGGERPSLPAEVELSISPFIDGLRIQWHNLSAIEGAGGIYIHLNLTGGNPPQPDERKIAIEDFSDDSYEIDGLDNGTAYRLVGVRVEQANNTFWVIDNITWSESWQAKTNALDNNGNGIVVGANHDGDGRADGVDEDDDNDGRPNNMDHCRLGEIGWLSTNSTLDYDSDGCRDEGTANNGHGEDTDDDNDGVDDVDEEAGCRLSSDCDNDMVLDVDEAMGCAKKPNCDDDYLIDSEDSCPNGEQGWNNNDGTNDNDSDGCRNDEDVDDDGDGLIEISTPAELDAVRWVLNGTGFKVGETAMLNQTGCGDGVNMTVCNGYELVRDIDLAEYITNNYPMVGWQPIAPDVDTGNTQCDGDRFTGIFDGNGFEVRGLFINRTEEICIGLFGRADGIIRYLGVIADQVVGNGYVGGLVGWSNSISIIGSYVVSDEVRGNGWIGGLMGRGDSVSIVQSYAVSRVVGTERGASTSYVGGLVGWGSMQSSKIIQSYAVSGTMMGSVSLGGLVGDGRFNSIVQSYAVNGAMVIISRFSAGIGGLVGTATNADISYSYAVTGALSGSSDIGGLVGISSSARASYWDRETSGRNNDGATGSSGQTTSALRSPTGYTDIYATWDDGAMVDGINDNTTIWCDEDASGMIEDDEIRDNTHANGDNRVWDFGSATDYPALRCTPDSPADQRAWWYLNTTSNRPQLDQSHLNAWLRGTLP